MLRQRKPEASHEVEADEEKLHAAHSLQWRVVRGLLYIGIAAILTLLGLAAFIVLRFGGAVAPSNDHVHALIPSHELHGGISGETEVVLSLSVPPGAMAISSNDRMFFSFHPEHENPSDIKVAEMKVVEGRGRLIYHEAFPDRPFQAGLRSVLGLHIDRQDRMWLLDHGLHGASATPKLVCIQLVAGGGRVESTHTFDKSVAGLGSMLSDIQVSNDGKVAYIADTSVIANSPALIIYDVERNSSRRILPKHAAFKAQPLEVRVEGEPFKFYGLWHLKVNLNSLLLDAAGEWLYFGALTGETVYRVRVEDLVNLNHDASPNSLEHVAQSEELAQRIEEYATKPPSEGMAIDREGNLYLAAVERSSIVSIRSGETKEARTMSLVVRDTKSLRWPKGLVFDSKYEYLYASSSALHHKYSGLEIRESGPYQIVRIKMRHADTRPAPSGQPAGAQPAASRQPASGPPASNQPETVIWT